MNAIPEVFKGLQECGLKCSDCVIVHSSYKAFGLENKSPCEVIYTFQQFLGTDGTLVMPTFTYSCSGIWNAKPFNPKTTPANGTGILSETLRKYPGALRSEHPTHSVAAIGKHALKITQNKEYITPIGRDSSFEQLYKLGARILLIGVTNNSNSMLHFAEVVARLPYIDIPFRKFCGDTAFVEKEEKIVEVPLSKEYPACSKNFNVVNEYLEKRQIVKHGKICQADCILMDAREMVDTVVENLKENPAWLLCDDFTCEPCNLRKHRLKERGML